MKDNQQIKYVILIGPQGSGKGTQARKLIDHFGWEYVEMGALIRKRAEQHDRKGEILDHLVNKKGELLPDGVVLDMLMDEMEETTNSTGYLFDGFPRSLRQYAALQELLADIGGKITVGIYLKISDTEAVKRLEARRHCGSCGKNYSLLLETDRKQCDCGGELVKRVDDESEAISKRLEGFHRETEPILKTMKKDGVLVEVWGEQEVDVIFEQMIEALKN